MKNKIITRFAPSPTGELHIGGARTALFSYLFAKNQGGEFLLRIEDTDRERFVEGSDKRIIESLTWLGISPDNLDDIIYQSKRLEIYRKFAEELVEKGDAYICTCSKEQLEADRKEQEKRGLPPKYVGRCRNNIKNQKSKIKNIEGAVVRMKMPETGKILVNDLIRGKVEFDTSLIDDQIILKSDGFPTYHLASVIDDHEMEITHVIRAEEWLSSTPKHLVLYKMLGFEPPAFAHLPMILGPDKKKLSKRHGATSVVDYKDQGYLPEAIVNFMALLGWNPKDEREEFSLSDLVREFSLKNVHKSPAIFDIEKLNSINAQQIKNQKSKIKNIIQNSKLFRIENISDGELNLIGRGGYNTLKEAADYILKLRKEPEYSGSLLIFKKSDKERTQKGLNLALKKLESLNQQWNNETIQRSLAEAVSEGELSNGDVFWPVRVALSGEERSPSPSELAEALGKEETLRRINSAIEKST